MVWKVLGNVVRKEMMIEMIECPMNGLLETLEYKK